MSIMVYWASEAGPQAQELKSSELLEALKLTEDLRKAGHRHVCISSELEDSVGKPGVNDVLPEGYDWKKRRD
jgi:hypothetical protein